MLTENDWVWLQNKGRSEGYTKWNKEKYTGNQPWREVNGDSMIWSRRKKKTSSWSRMKKQEFKKNEANLRNLRNNVKHYNIRIIRDARRRRGRARNWKLIWTNNEGALPQSGQGNRLLESPGSSESPKEVGPKEAYTKAHHHYPRLKISRQS